MKSRLSIATRTTRLRQEGMFDTVNYAPIHPGEILKTEFLDEIGMTPYALARNIGINRGDLLRIINCKSAIFADTALRLARYFGTSASSLMILQSHYDIEMAKYRGPRRIEREVLPCESLTENAASDNRHHWWSVDDQAAPEPEISSAASETQRQYLCPPLWMYCFGASIPNRQYHFQDSIL